MQFRCPICEVAEKARAERVEAAPAATHRLHSPVVMTCGSCGHSSRLWIFCTITQTVLSSWIEVGRHVAEMAFARTSDFFRPWEAERVDSTPAE